MLKYILRRLLSLVGTMIVISILIFAIVEIAPGNVARNMIGNLATPQQEESISKQLGLDRPVYIRYISWLFGSDWYAQRTIGYPLVQTITDQGTVKNYRQWWAVDPDGSLVQWDVVDGKLYRLVRNTDNTVIKVLDEEKWKVDSQGIQWFWGIDNNNRAVRWDRGTVGLEYTITINGWKQVPDSPVQYIPLSKGLLRGEAGVSFLFRKPVSDVIGRKITNSAILAGLAFLVTMPLAVMMGLMAGLSQGKPLDRLLSLAGLVTTASPDFATGIIVIMIFAIWLKVLPGATVFLSEDAILKQPQMMILPVLTISLAELGYVLRITRVSVIDVMNSNYVRTAILKGLPYRTVVIKHILRNALMAPITIIMLHVNWLIGGLVVVESLYGYPGLGNFIYNAALYKDVYSIEAGAMIMIVLAVGTQLVADILYAMLNPRIRYS